MIQTPKDREYHGQQTAAELVAEGADGIWRLRDDVTYPQVAAMGLLERVKLLLKQLND
jgi:hypothetical protein